jgi:thioredoxin-dependent peroxiredoxin
MIRALLALALAVAASPLAADALEAGDAAPDFTAPAALAGQAQTFSLAEARAKGPVVVYFYPSAYTGGCNVQARGFADRLEKFRAAHATIVGVSLDSIERLKAFSADPEYCGGKFAVASDPDGAIAAQYGVGVMKNRLGLKDTRGETIDHGFAERTTFVVTRDGRIANTIGGVSPAANVEAALEAVQALAKPSTAP